MLVDGVFGFITHPLPAADFSFRFTPEIVFPLNQKASIANLHLYNQDHVLPKFYRLVAQLCDDEQLQYTYIHHHLI